jgi:FMN phosphatase YigB (HAD superfamily)
MTPLKVVFVDWYGTLSSSRFFEHWSAPDHPRRETFDVLQAWWVDPASQPFLDEWLTGARDVEDFVDAMSGLFGLPREEVSAELMASLDHWTLLEPETKSLLAALRERGVRVVLATDNVDACIRWAVPALGLDDAFDAILSSHERGACKYQTDASGRSPFFGDYLEAHGIGPGESALIDASIALEPVMEAHGIRFLHAPKGTGPGAHLRQILRTLPDG